jgi:Spx/MgsR family transcriptional regulator
MPWVVYGISTCDSVKKATSWLKNQQIAYRLHDYRVDGVDSELLIRFLTTLGIDAVLNQRSTSWRNLSTEQKNDICLEKALALMLTTPTLIKRPILDTGEKLVVGFDPDIYTSLS